MHSRIASLCTTFLFFPILSFSQTFTEHDTTTVPGAVKVIRADFNHDSIPDFALANHDSNTVSIFLMNANGTFRGRQDFTTGLHPTGIIAADFNHDRKPDLATSNADADNSHSIALLLGNGDGTFQPPRFFYGGTKPVNIGWGDFNKDGNADVVTAWLAITNPNDPTAKQTNEILVTYGDGREGFSSQLSLSDIGDVEPAGERDRRMRKLAVGDFNGDGRPDIAFIEGGGGLELQVGDIFTLMNTGNSFIQRKVSDVPDPNDISTSDVNQDGLDDILLARIACSTDFCGEAGDEPAVDYFQNKSDGTFSKQNAMLLPGDEFLDSLNDPVAADLNGDGLKDIAVFSHVSRLEGGPQDEHAEVRVAFQRPDGTFSRESPFQRTFFTNMNDGADRPASGLLADINRDGRVDMLVSSGNGLVGTLINVTPVRGCPATDSFRKVRICLPLFSTVSSPVQILANTRNGLPIEAMKIYVNGVSKFFTTDDLLSARLNLPLGDHKMEVKAWDRSGSFAQTITFTVAGGCVLSGIDRTVKVCAPAGGTSVASPVHIQATVSDSGSVNAAQIYVDGALKFSTGFTHFVDTSLAITSGNHRITVKAWDAAGQFSQTLNVKVQ